MTEFGTLAFAWLATAWLHGLFLFAAAWTAERLGLLKSGGLRQTAWRGVLLVPLVTAALQLGAFGGSPTLRQDLAPAPVAAARGVPVSNAVVDVPLTSTTTVRARGVEPAQVMAVLPPALGLAWLGWIALMGLRVGLQRLKLMVYRRRLTPLTEAEALASAEALRERAGLKQLRLYEDPDLAGPVALASGDIVLPAWTRDALTAPQHHALLAHEVRHLARRDPEWRALLGLAAIATLAPHARLALSRLDELAEEACDAWSARATGEGRALAQCLAACLERGLRDRAPGWSAAMASGPVVERVRKLLDGSARFEHSPPGRGVLLLAGLGAAAIALPGFAVGAPALAAPGAPAPVAWPALAPLEAVTPAEAPLAVEPIVALEPLDAPDAGEPTVAPLAPLAPLAAIEPLDALPALPAPPEAPEPPTPPTPPSPVVAPATPANPATPAVPAVPARPAIAAVPAVPAVPAIPAIPAEPAAPAVPRPH